MASALALTLLIALFLLAAITRIGALVIDRRFPPEGRFVDTTAGPLHVLERGPASGAAIVLIHGASGNVREMDLALGRTLSASRRVVVVDRPGHGHSALPASRAFHAPDAQARAVAEALRAIGVERAVVVGHSWGASVALALALEAPDLVRGVVASAPATHPWPGGGISWHNRLAAVPVVGWLFAAIVPLPAGLVVLGPASASAFRPQAMPVDYPWTTGIPLVLRPAHFVSNAGDLVDFLGHVTRLQPRYRDIAVPVVAVSGTTDPIVFAGIHTAGIVRDIPGARAVWLDGIGHMPHWVAREALLAEIEAMAALVLAPALSASPPGPGR